MQIVKELAELTSEQETMLTVGVFDGVHLGHQHLIKKLNEQAAERKLLSGVVTFRGHPEEVLCPQIKLAFLTSLEERISLIQNLGVEFTAILSFTPEVAQLSARQFVSSLKEQLKMQGLVIGPDFALGRGREGNATVLNALGQELGFTVTSVPKLTVEGQVVSSTLIREALSQGDMKRVARLLGRYFTLSGVVVTGSKRGRLLGFPTANIAPQPSRALPPDGVYVTWAQIDNKLYRAATNIGVSPTFDGGERMIEAYVLDFNGDLYGCQVTLQFIERIRDEVHFATPEELQQQIDRDVEIAKAVLKKKRGPN
jgi:riboflavin kinase/FMN adenylyltransferase